MHATIHLPSGVATFVLRRDEAWALARKNEPANVTRSLSTKRIGHFDPLIRTGLPGRKGTRAVWGGGQCLVCKQIATEYQLDR